MTFGAAGNTEMRNYRVVKAGRPAPETEIDRYWRLFTETNVGCERGRDVEREPRHFKLRVRREYIRLIDTPIVFEFDDGKLIGIRHCDVLPLPHAVNS